MFNRSKFNVYIASVLKFVFGETKIKYFFEKKYINLYSKNKLVFIHIPKAAGTSVTELLYGKRNGHLSAKVVKSRLKNFESKISFSVSRNPYTRLESAYRFAKLGNTKNGAISDAKKYQVKEFSTFESFVKEWLVNQNVESLDPVFQPQYKFVCNNKEEFLLDKIFKLENLTDLEVFLSNELDKKVKIGVINKTNNLKKNFEYSKEIKEIIYSIYEKDFILLGYDK